MIIQAQDDATRIARERAMAQRPIFRPSVENLHLQVNAKGTATVTVTWRLPEDFYVVGINLLLDRPRGGIAVLVTRQDHPGAIHVTSESVQHDATIIANPVHLQGSYIVVVTAMPGEWTVDLIGLNQESEWLSRQH